MINKKILICFLILLIDGFWIFLNNNKYQNLVKKVQGKNIVVDIKKIILGFAFAVGTLVLFAIPYVELIVKNYKYSKLYASFIYGGGLGFFIYGLYNFTNYGIFENYNLYTAILDTFWGGFLYFIITYIYLIL